MDARVRELTFDERARWGECPVCHAKDGEACNRYVAIPLGVAADGGPPANGAHLGRLNAAPQRVRTVPA